MQTLFPFKNGQMPTAHLPAQDGRQITRVTFLLRDSVLEYGHQSGADHMGRDVSQRRGDLVSLEFLVESVCQKMLFHFPMAIKDNNGILNHRLGLLFSGCIFRGFR